MSLNLNATCPFFLISHASYFFVIIIITIIIILFYLCIYLFYKFISKGHLNEKGTHPFLWFAVRCVM